MNMKCDKYVQKVHPNGLLLFDSLLLLGRLSSLGDRNALVLNLHPLNSWGCNSQNPIRRQLGLHFANVAVLRQNVSSHKVPGNVSMLVLFLLVLALDGQNIFARDFDADFFRFELLHVQVRLELVLVQTYSGAAVLAASAGTPVSQISGWSSG